MGKELAIARLGECTRPDETAGFMQNWFLSRKSFLFVSFFFFCPLYPLVGFFFFFFLLKTFFVAIFSRCPMVTWLHIAECPSWRLEIRVGRFESIYDNNMSSYPSEAAAACNQCNGADRFNPMGYRYACVML